VLKVLKKHKSQSLVTFVYLQRGFVQSRSDKQSWGLYGCTVECHFWCCGHFKSQVIQVIIHPINKCFNNFMLLRFVLSKQQPSPIKGCEFSISSIEPLIIPVEDGPNEYTGIYQVISSYSFEARGQNFGMKTHLISAIILNFCLGVEILKLKVQRAFE